MSDLKVECNWEGKTNFVAQINGFKIHMDATKPFGDESAPTPKQLVLAALCGCTGMDVVSLLKKYKQPPEKFTIHAEASTATTHPNEFNNILLTYTMTGRCAPGTVAEIVKLSQSKYCAVSAMISRAASISFEVLLNGKSISKDRASFRSFRPSSILQEHVQ